MTANVCLAMTWIPRGEHERLRRFYPTLQTIYRNIVVTVPPDVDAAVLDVLRTLRGLGVIDHHWEAGRHTAIRAGLETGADFVHYVDCDRLVRWVETRPD